MKKACVYCFVLFVAAALNAAPFGLKMGMTMQEVKEASSGVTLRSIPDLKDAYSFVPAKTHPLFSQYVVQINDTVGLYGIFAVGDDMKLDNYGTQIKDAFDNIVERVSKTYGTPLITDTLAPDTMWKDDKYWTNAFHDGARKLSAQWPRKATDKLSDDLYRVAIAATSTGYNTGRIVLGYSFNNSKSVQDEEDDVF